MKGETKSEFIIIRLKPSEKNEFKKIAKEESTRVSDVIRKKLGLSK